MNTYDAIIVGAGFYGCKIALKLHELGVKKVLLVEKEQDLLLRASLINQARVHNGYHYPRSLKTAQSSRKYYKRFQEDYDYSIEFDMRKLYAIARNSKVSANQFSSFCRKIGAPVLEATRSVRNLFDSALIEAVFFTDEIAFNAAKIRERLRGDIMASDIELSLKSEALFHSSDDKYVYFNVNGRKTAAKFVINCTYADLDRLGFDLKTNLRKEWAEMAMIKPPHEIQGYGVTVMDGPFFSTMPYPARDCYSLSHVRYTPIGAWHSDSSEASTNLNQLRGYKEIGVNYESMIRDSSRYLPIMKKAQYLGSIFDIKVVMVQEENNDGRPILLEKAPFSPRVLSCLGGKIDNIYDVLDKISESEFLDLALAS